MKKFILALAVGSCCFSAIAQVKKSVTTAKKPLAKPATASANPFKNNNDSVSYALGVRIAQSMKSQGFENVNMAIFQKAMADVANKSKLLIGDESINQCIGIYQQKASAEKSLVIKKEGLAFLAANGKRKGVVTLPSGLQYEVIKAGTDNTKPTLNSKVKCHYHGTLINGTVFDSSVDRGEPITFNLNGVIRGWQEALQLMTVGSKWKLYIPSDLAYGDSAPSPTIGPGSTLIFEVELLGVEN
jgi:FKBP-type peptidyl-prolyl cis-trans isomerase FklB